MSRRRVLTPLLIAILMLTSTYNVSATDSDGDGTDDANDAFPDDPCADTDTDGDGMPDTLASGCSGDYVVAHTSFEDPFTNPKPAALVDRVESRLLSWVWDAASPVVNRVTSLDFSSERNTGF